MKPGAFSTNTSERITQLLAAQRSAFAAHPYHRPLSGARSCARSRGRLLAIRIA